MESLYTILVYIDISIYSHIISWYLSDRHLIDTSIVHILYDHVIIRDICDDTDMSIVSIVSSSRELYDSSW